MTTGIILSEASGVPFYRQIHDQLIEKIRRGDPRAGEPLPSVRRLATELMVSVITTRRAYTQLQAGGWVERRRGLGTFVAQSIRPRALGASVTKATNRLDEAVAEALQLGMTADEIRAAVELSITTKSWTNVIND